MGLNLVALVTTHQHSGCCVKYEANLGYRRQDSYLNKGKKNLYININGLNTCHKFVNFTKVSLELLTSSDPFASTSQELG